MAQVASTQSSSGPSGLLHCLSKLNDDVFAEVMLPKLVEQGSVAAVALTCSQLRHLCFHSIQSLKLSTLTGAQDLNTVEDWVAPLPQHFSNCSKVELCFNNEQHYHVMPCVLPALARLPKLDRLNLTLTEHSSTPSALCSVLCLVRTQLTSLRTLSLDISQDWTGREPRSVWRQLARMTSLTSLDLYTAYKDGPSTTPGELVELSVLTALQDLEIKLTLSAQGDAPSLQQSGLPHGLTALTSVELEPCRVDELRHFTSCVMLEDMYVDCAPEDKCEMGPEDWACVAPLTRLKRLMLYNSLQQRACPARCSVLQQLTRLQVVAADLWNSQVLPDLTVCTALREIGGSFVGGAALLPPNFKLPTVTRLFFVWGAVPFEVFPSLRAVRQAAPISLQAWLQLSKHCLSMETLTVQQWEMRNSRSIDSADVHSGMRLEALRGLTSLTGLTRLDFAPSNVDDVMAFMSAAASLAAGGLQELGILLSENIATHRAIVESALVQLAKFQSLQTLHLYLCNEGMFTSRAQVELVLCAACGVRCLVVSCQAEEQQVAVTAGMSRLEQANLPRPGRIELRLCKFVEYY